MFGVLLRFTSLLSLLVAGSALAVSTDVATSAKPYLGLQANHLFIEASQRHPSNAIDFTLDNQTNYGLIAGVEFPLNSAWLLAAELLWQPNGHSYTISAPVSVPPVGMVATQTRGDLSGSRALSLHLGYQINPSDRVFAKVMRGSYDWQLVTKTAQAPLPTTTLATNQGSDFFTAVGLGYQKALTANWWLRPEAIFFVDTEADKNPLFKFTTYELALSLGYRF